MRTNDDDDEGGRRQPAATDADAGPEMEPAGAVEGSKDEEDDDEADDGPRITLDRYLSQRRPPTSGLWHLFVAALMLVTLVLIVMYKDQCARAVTNVVREASGPGPSRPPVRIELKTPEKAK